MHFKIESSNIYTEDVISIENNKIHSNGAINYYKTLIVPGYDIIDDDEDAAEHPDDANDMVIVPIESNEDNCYYESSGIYIIYDRNNDFAPIGKVCNPNYHDSAKGYERYALHFKTNGFRVHIDLMPDGSYRYVSWKSSQKPSEEPRIVIQGGRFDKSLHKYTFENDGYQYVVGYKSATNNNGYRVSASAGTS